MDIKELIEILDTEYTVDDYIDQLKNLNINCTKKELDLFMRSSDMRSNNKFNALFDKSKLSALELLNKSINNSNFNPENVLKTDYLMCLWKENKIIYELDNDFVSALIETEIDEIPTQIFSYVPCNQMVINLTGGGLLIDINKKFNYITLNIITLTTTNIKNAGYGYGLYSISFDSRKEYITPNSITKFKNIDKIIYSFLMYISNPTPGDISKDNKSYKYTSKYDNKSMNINKWNIGFRYGNTVRALKKENKNNNRKVSINMYKKHASPRPHIRKGHWHAYKVGEGRKKVIVKWIAPILVNSKDTKDIIPTIQKVVL